MRRLLKVKMFQNREFRSRSKSVSYTHLAGTSRSAGADLNAVANVSIEPVSYTHLDVYKRQDQNNIYFMAETVDAITDPSDPAWKMCIRDRYYIVKGFLFHFISMI